MSLAGSRAESIAGGGLSRAESCASGRLTRAKSIKAKSERGIEHAPRNKRRKAYEARVKPQEEISAGQIWDFWAVKANKLISNGLDDNVGATFDTVTDAILGKPKLSEEEERMLKRQQEERLRRQQKAARKQQALLENMKEAVFGKSKTQDEIDEEIRLQEESVLQAQQLDWLQRKFEGELTLL
jgi:hypothetical protein